MDNKFLVLFLCVAIACFCSAEFSADTVYEILPSKMDILFFNIKNLRRDIDEINESARKTGGEQCKEACLEVKQMFESYKAEMNEKFISLEVKVTERVDKLVQEALVSLTGTINGKLSEADNERNKESKQQKTNMRRFVSSEKRALRISNNKFENDTRKNIKDITDMFEIRIQNTEQSVALFTNKSAIRMKEVENKMFAFENASWKGERGDIGPTGQKGERGIKGEKGYAGVKGSKGEIGVGIKGQKGERGDIGPTGPRGERGIKGEQGNAGFKGSKGEIGVGIKGQKGERGDIGPTGPRGERGIKGEKGYAGVKGSKGEIGVGIKGQKGERGYTGQTESRRSVYFHVGVADGPTRLFQETIVKFDNVLTSEGQGYSTSTGKFTAPYSGVYLFLFFVRPGGDKYDIAYFTLYVNGYRQAYTTQQSLQKKHETMGGQAYVVYMYKGHRAWIQTGRLTDGGYHNFKPYGTTFTGVLIN